MSWTYTCDPRGWKTASDCSSCGSAPFAPRIIFLRIARYLEEQGWIEDAEANYGVFVVSASGIAEAIG